MPYTPKINELVTTLVPDEPNEKPEIALVASLATKEQKLRYVERLKSEIGADEEFDSEGVETFLNNNTVYVCLYKDEIKLVDAEFIIGPLKPQEDEENQPETP